MASQRARGARAREGVDGPGRRSMQPRSSAEGRGESLALVRSQSRGAPTAHVAVSTSSVPNLHFYLCTTCCLRCVVHGLGAGFNVNACAMVTVIRMVKVTADRTARTAERVEQEKPGAERACG